MATETVSASAESAAPAAVPSGLRDQVQSALHTALMRAQAVLAILDKGEFYALAATEGDETYALATAAECLLKDIAATAQAAITAIDGAGRVPAVEVAHV